MQSSNDKEQEGVIEFSSEICATPTLTAYGSGICRLEPRRVKKVAYLLVKADGKTYKLAPDVPTPSNVINLCQFICLIQMYAMGGGWDNSPEWSKIIKDLGIERHFQLMEGEQNTDTFYISLFDPKE